MSARRLERAGWVVGALLVLSAIPASPPAAAQEDPGFGGYQIVATGAGFTVAPTVPAVLPVETPIEGTLSLALATLSTGGLGYGLASSAYPGTPIVGIRPLLEIGAGVALPIPDYPLVVESREYEDPQSTRQPGIAMATDVDAGRSRATADLGGFSLPGVIDVGSVRTVSTSIVEPARAAATVTTEINGIDILDGTVHIDTISTLAAATTDAAVASCEGGVTVSGATVGGEAATIDESGLHASEQSVVPIADASTSVADALAATGVTVRMLGGSESCDGATADRSTSGVLVSIPLPSAGAVPPGGRLDIVLGAASARALATAPFEAPADALSPTDDPPSISDVVLRVPEPSTGAVPSSNQSPAPTGATPSVGDAEPTVSVASEPPAYSFGGVPAGLVIGLMLLAIPGSRPIRRYMEHVASGALAP